MDDKVKSALTSMVFGLIFIFVPVFAGSNVSSVLGLIFVISGLLTVVFAYLNREESRARTIFNILFGIILLILGIAFVLNLNELAFIYSLMFYILGIIFILSGIFDYLSDRYNKMQVIFAIVLLVFGIISIIIAAFFNSNTVVSAVFLGLCLLIRGFKVLISD